MGVRDSKDLLGLANAFGVFQTEPLLNLLMGLDSEFSRDIESANDGSA